MFGNNRSALSLPVLLSAALLSSLVYSSVAVASPDLKVGYVDMQRALTGSRAGSEAQKKYEDEVKKSQVKIDEKKKEFEAQKAEFAKQRDSLSEKARTEREDKLISMEKELRRSFQDAQEKLRRSNAGLVGELVKKLRTVVERMGKEESFTMILERGGQSVLYADNQIDLTERVIKEFDSAQ